MEKKMGLQRQNAYFAEFAYRTASGELNMFFETFPASSLSKAKVLAKAMIGLTDRHVWLNRVEQDLTLEQRATLDATVSKAMSSRIVKDVR